MPSEYTNAFENIFQSGDSGKTESQNSSSLSASLWQELGKTVAGYLGADKSAARENRTQALDFSVGSIYGERAGESPAAGGDGSVAAPTDGAAAPARLEAAREERARLTGIVESLSGDERQFEKLQADMDKFEARANNGEVTAEEVVKTYSEVSRLLEGECTTYVDDGQRETLAKQIIEQAADPTSIDQGSHNTCNVTTIESRMYSRNPSDAARLVADVVLSGEFVTADGKTVVIDDQNLVPDDESKNTDSSAQRRSYASQIFQLTAANVYWQRRVTDLQGNTVTEGDIHYDQVAKSDSNSTGEALRNHSTNPPAELLDSSGNEAHDPHLVIHQYGLIYNQITGRSDGDFLLAHKRSVENSALSNFESIDEFRDQLKNMKELGTLPAIIRVDSYNEPFLTDGGGGDVGGFGGYHVVTVTDYDANADRVSIDNQWGKDSDKQGENSMSVQDLYLATWESTSQTHLDEMEGLLEKNSENGIDNPYAELDLLRLQYDADMIPVKESEKWLAANSDASLFLTIPTLIYKEAVEDEANKKFDTALADKIVQIEQQWRVEEGSYLPGEEGSLLDQSEVKRVDAKLQSIVEAMDGERQYDLTERVREALSKGIPAADNWELPQPSSDPLADAAARHQWWWQLQPEE